MKFISDHPILATLIFITTCYFIFELADRILYYLTVIIRCWPLESDDEIDDEDNEDDINEEDPPNPIRLNRQNKSIVSSIRDGISRFEFMNRNKK